MKHRISKDKQIEQLRAALRWALSNGISAVADGSGAPMFRAAGYGDYLKQSPAQPGGHAIDATTQAWREIWG